MTGDGFFLVMPYCNTDCMNLFLQELSKKYSDDFIVLACDGAIWHKSYTLQIPENIELVFIPPYTPEMNPIEQIWEELREKGFKIKSFKHLIKLLKDFVMLFVILLLTQSKALLVETGFCLFDF